MDRRSFLIKGSALATTALSPVALIGRAYGFEAGRPLPVPDVIDFGAETQKSPEHVYAGSEISLSIP